MRESSWGKSRIWTFRSSIAVGLAPMAVCRRSPVEEPFVLKEEFGRAAEIYRTLGEMPGSAMPGTDFQTEEDLWAVVHYIRSLIEPDAQERVRQRRGNFKSSRLSTQVAEDSDGSVLERGRANLCGAHASLAAGRTHRGHRPAGGGRRRESGDLPFLEGRCRKQGPIPRDRVRRRRPRAVLKRRRSPLFGMGDQAGAVNIWRWKAVWESGRRGLNDTTKTYPRSVMDFDMSVKRLEPASLGRGWRCFCARESLNKVVLARWLVEVVRKERLQPGCRRILRLNPADFDCATPIFDPAATASTPLLRLGAGMDARLLYCGAQAVA